MWERARRVAGVVTESIFVVAVTILLPVILFTASLATLAGPAQLF